MGPHSDHLYCSDLLQDLVDKTVLNIDSPGVGPGKVADELLIGWRGLVRILGQNSKKFLGLFFARWMTNSSVSLNDKALMGRRVFFLKSSPVIFRIANFVA